MSPRHWILLMAAFTAANALALDLGGLTKALTNPGQKDVDTLKDGLKAFKGAVAGIGLEEELTIGESVSVEIIGRYGGLLRDEAATQRVNLIGRALAAYSDRPELAWRFGVLNSDTVNAFSAPGGFVFITRGLHELAGSDDVLAGILAHEIAHITAKHALGIVRRDEFFSAVTNQVRQRSNQARELDAKVEQFDVGVKEITKGILDNGFDAPKEYAADLTGRQLAVTTGYAPGGLRTMLVRLQQTPARSKRIFSTHPPLTERIKRLPADGVTPSASPTKPGATKAAPAGTDAPATDAVGDDDRAFADAADTKPAEKKQP